MFQKNVEDLQTDVPELSNQAILFLKSKSSSSKWSQSFLNDEPNAWRLILANIMLNNFGIMRGRKSFKMHRIAKYIFGLGVQVFRLHPYT